MSSLRALRYGLLGAVVVTAGLAAQQPLDTVGPIEKQSNPITPENPIPRRTFAPAANYPAEARGLDAIASVVLVATLDANGRVVEIRKVREPMVMPSSGAVGNPTALRIAGDAFVRDAAIALRQWQYDPPAKPPLSFSVSFMFKPGAEAAATQNSTVPGVSAGVGSLAASQPSPFPPGAIRVGGNVKAPTQVNKVAPIYPAIAQSARVQGVVILEALIGIDGRVSDARVLRSIPLLDQAALDAVKQWQYTPTLLNGVPSPVIMTVTVTFNLPEPSQAQLN